MKKPHLRWINHMTRQNRVLTVSIGNRRRLACEAKSIDEPSYNQHILYSSVNPSTDESHRMCIDQWGQLTIHAPLLQEANPLNCTYKYCLCCCLNFEFAKNILISQLKGISLWHLCFYQNTAWNWLFTAKLRRSLFQAQKPQRHDIRQYYKYQRFIFKCRLMDEFKILSVKEGKKWRRIAMHIFD